MTVSLAAFLLAVSLGGAAGPPRPPSPREARVPMRDGTPLAADVLLPSPTGRFPTLVYRTPYDRRGMRDSPIVARALARGYAVVLQDVRGRYGSEGEFVPYRNEGRDGYDTIEWAAAQPWSNGDVGTFGLSYPAAVQWLAAVESPPHLKAMVPAMTFSSPRNFFYAGGAFDLSWIPWIWNNIAPDARARRGLPGPRSEKEARRAWKDLRSVLPFRMPLTDLPELEAVAPYYFDWLAHRPADAWWDWAELRGRYGRVKAAVLNVSGWHDEMYGPEGAITNFQGLLAARAGERDPRDRLVLGPWVHGGIESERSGRRVFGPAAKLDEAKLVLDFLDRYVRGVEDGPDREPRVRAFVMGKNRWVSGETWPLPGTEPLSLYLSAGGRLQTRAPSEERAASRFVSDPARPVVDPHGDSEGANDLAALASRPDVLVFETDPLPADLRVVGAVDTEMYLSSDAPDVDLWVNLQDVSPAGVAWNLSSPGSDVLRASERGGGSPELLAPGRVVVLRLPNLRTGNLFAKGHRVRVVLCGSFLPHFSRNPQTGRPETLSARTRRASVWIHHDARYPSRLVLPVVPDRPPR